MSYKTLLVYVGAASQVPPLLRVCQHLAAQGDDVRVMGLHVVPQIPVYPDMAFMVTSEMVDLQRNALVEKCEQAAAAFRDQAEQLGLDWQWRDCDANGKLVADRVMEQGRSADLIIGAQEDPEADNESQQGVLEHVLMRGGRPVLLVPYAGEVTVLGERVVLAWNGSRESARAAFDALPVLQQANTVELLWAKPADVEETDVAFDDIVESLARHGVAIESHQMDQTDRVVGGDILARLDAQGCDLLVMGAYGHSRFHELVFGGVTRHVLQHMRVPVMMSH
ncbi:MAG TPA: hypothetical protein DD979_15845 [Gammaproteobacteria bacterium]|jgi:nucleotide-binding universal stress UspA family protein|nr:hypothetical protein [Gammaproteobacteria bacterium]